jgi:hypothetical protein
MVRNHKGYNKRGRQWLWNGKRYKNFRVGSCNVLSLCASGAWKALLNLSDSSAIALAASRRLVTAAARVRFQDRSCGICNEQSDTGAGFFRVLRFPPSFIPPTVPHSSSIMRSWYNRPSSGLSEVGLPVQGGVSLSEPSLRAQPTSSRQHFFSNHNYISFYKLICCDYVWREEAYPKISPH